MNSALAVVIIVLLTFLVAVTCAKQAPAATVILQWDRNASVDKVTGYNLYNNNVRFSNTTSNRIIMTNISTSKQYRFNVTAVNAFTESGYSNTVELLIPAAPVLKTVIKGQLEIQ